MKLPGRDRGIIEPAKVRDYLLSETHPIGRWKAPFFTALGFSSSRWPELERALFQLARSGSAKVLNRTRFGQKYAVRGIIQGRTRRAAVISIWIVQAVDDRPRLVTAYPEGGPHE